MLNDDYFKSIERYHAKRRSEFEKLACEPCLTEASVGDRVLVSAGAAGRGFEWERLEAVVLEVADTAYKLEFVGRGYTDIGWIHKFIVTDVLGPQVSS
jgi:hypothetical protein